jgi:hypothetical protein
MMKRIHPRLREFVTHLFWIVLGWSAVTGIYAMWRDPAEAPPWYLIAAVIVGCALRAIFYPRTALRAS